MGIVSTLDRPASGRTEPADQAVRLYTVLDAAKVLGVSRGFVYKMIDAGEIRAVELGTNCKSKLRVRADDLQSFIDARTHGSADAA